MKNTRYLVYRALMRVENDGAYSNLVLDEALSDGELEAREKAFFANLFYGVLERKLSLDYIIRQFSGVRLKKIEPKVLMILRVAVYQLVFMDKVPDSAAVNEAVKLCKKEKLYRSSGFVNGLLRSLTRAEDRFPLPDSGDTAKYLSVKYSCPEPIVSLWLRDYGDKAEEILKALDGRPPLYIRVNTGKITENDLIGLLAEQGITAEKTALPNALSLRSAGAVAEIPAYREGLFHVQDIASQLCCSIVDAQDGEIISDVCAAPGGKSLTIAQSVGSGKVYAYDIYDHKLKLIGSSAKRLGIYNIETAERDAQKGDRPLEMSDRILCDVPCSGLGVLRRKPEIRYKEDLGIDALPPIQLEILEKAASFVKSGGRLVYSTCTLNKRENNDNAASFLDKHPEFEPLPITFPEGFERAIDEEENCLTLLPEKNGPDGFFIAAFRRK